METFGKTKRNLSLLWEVSTPQINFLPKSHYLSFSAQVVCTRGRIMVTLPSFQVKFASKVFLIAHEKIEKPLFSTVKYTCALASPTSKGTRMQFAI